MLNKIEVELMDSLTLILYINAFIYYLVVFGCPFLFLKECGEGIDMASHIIYAVYSAINLFIEILTLLWI